MKASTTVAGLLWTCILGLTTFACAAPPVAEGKGSTTSRDTKSAAEIIEALKPKGPPPSAEEQERTQRYLNQLRQDEAARKNKRSDNESEDPNAAGNGTNVAAGENQDPYGQDPYGQDPFNTAADEGCGDCGLGDTV